MIIEVCIDHDIGLYVAVSSVSHDSGCVWCLQGVTVCPSCMVWQPSVWLCVCRVIKLIVLCFDLYLSEFNKFIWCVCILASSQFVCKASSEFKPSDLWSLCEICFIVKPTCVWGVNWALVVHAVCSWVVVWLDVPSYVSSLSRCLI